MSDINRILALSGLAQNGINMRAAVSDVDESIEKDNEMAEAVGDSAEPFYKLQDDFCGGESPSHAHRAFIDEIARWMTGDQVADFVEHIRRHYDMNDTEENVEEADIELSPGISIKTDKPGIYKGTKTTSGVVGGKSGEAMELANRVIDAIEEQDPSSSEEALELAKKFCHEMDCTDEAKKMVYKQLAKMGYSNTVADSYDPELSAMANSRDKVESTYAAIIKGDAEQTEVGDYIGHGMTKDQILKLIDMLEPQGYDKDFLLKDLAPMMEAGGDKVDNSELSRILKLSGLEVSEDQIDDEEVDEAQVTENKMSEKVTEIVDIIMKLAERETEQWADDPEMDGGDANYFMSVARELEGSDWDMARDAILDGDTAPKEEVLSIIADNSPELLKALFPQDAEKEQYLATMRRESISEQLKDELINELMGD